MCITGSGGRADERQMTQPFGAGGPPFWQGHGGRPIRIAACISCTHLYSTTSPCVPADSRGQIIGEKAGSIMG